MLQNSMYEKKVLVAPVDMTKTMYIKITHTVSVGNERLNFKKNVLKTLN